MTEYVLAVNAVSVTLRFRVANSQGDVSAEVDGVRYPAPSGQSVVTAFIRTAALFAASRSNQAPRHSRRGMS